jgi:hypothetical protein
MWLLIRWIVIILSTYNWVYWAKHEAAMPSIMSM